MNLTNDQCRAVTTEAKHVLVVAPAGSGKTRVLVARVIHLLESGISPNSIMVISFTRRAAGELKERLLAQLGGDEAAEKTLLSLTIGTVHSVCLQILQTYGERLGYRLGKPITVLDPADAKMLLQIAGRELGYYDGKKWKAPLSGKKVGAFLERYYCQDEMKAPVAEQRMLDKIMARYFALCWQMHVVDFGMILRQTQRLFAEHADVLEMYKKRYQYVLCDEAQDSSSVEFSLYEALASDTSLFLVGDLNQSIYGFRHARPDILRGWVTAAGVVDGFEVLHLRENFRSGDVIVDVANRLIAHNADPLSLPMIGATGRAGIVEHFTGGSEAIVAECQARHGIYRWSDIAVLGRTHRVLRRLESVFREVGVPVFRVGRSFDLTETDTFRDCLASMKLVVNPADDLAFLRLSALFDIGAAQLAEARSRAARNRQSLFDAYMTLAEEADSIARAIWFYSISEESPNLTELLYEPKEGALPPSWLADYIAINHFWETNCSNMTVAKALEWYATFNPERGDDLRQEDAITLITAHAAKGLEYPIVVVAELNEGVWPSKKSAREAGGIEEERRLFYVAQTRAREVLLLHHREEVDQNPEWEIRGPSRFLKECSAAVAQSRPA